MPATQSTNVAATSSTLALYSREKKAKQRSWQAVATAGGEDPMKEVSETNDNELETKKMRNNLDIYIYCLNTVEDDENYNFNIGIVSCAMPWHQEPVINKTKPVWWNVRRVCFTAHFLNNNGFGRKTYVGFKGKPWDDRKFPPKIAMAKDFCPGFPLGLQPGWDMWMISLTKSKAENIMTILPIYHPWRFHEPCNKKASENPILLK